MNMDAFPNLPDFPIDEQAILLGILFDQMPMGVAVFDRNLILQRCNPTWAGFVEKYGPRGLGKIHRGLHFYEMNPGNQAVLVPIVHRVLAGESIQQESLRLQIEDMVSYWDITILPILDSGRVESFLIVSVDATQRTISLQELAKSYQTLEERVAERTRELGALNAISAVVSRSLDLKQILADALEKTMQVMEMDFGVAYQVEQDEADPESAEIYPLAQAGFSDKFVSFAGALPLIGSTIQQAARLREPFVWLPAEPGDPILRQILEQFGALQAVTVPLMVKDHLVGAIILGAYQYRVPTPEECALLAAIGQQIGVAVENSHLREQAEQSAAMAERNRLARELHDSVTQSLYSVTLYAEAANRLLAANRSSEAAEYLRELRETSQAALREMRLLIFELRPLALEKVGLVDALRMRLESVESRGGIQTELVVNGIENLPYPLQEELYQVATEALNNLLKHAHARQASISLTVENGEIRLEVVDDGDGFDPKGAASSGGFGLAGMRERAQRLEGKLEIFSTPGQGTRVGLCVPIPNPNLPEPGNQLRRNS